MTTGSRLLYAPTTPEIKLAGARGPHGASFKALPSPDLGVQDKGEKLRYLREYLYRVPREIPVPRASA